MVGPEVVYGILAGLGFAVAGALGGLGVAVSETLRGAAAAIAAGILLPLAIVGLFTESLGHAGLRQVALAFSLGFVLLFAVEAVGKAHTHHTGAGEDLAEAPSRLAHEHTLMPFLIGIGMHNVADGAVIATAVELSQDAAVVALSGVFVHQLPVGVSFAAVCVALGLGRRALLGWAVLLGAMISLTTVVVAAAGGWDDAWLGAMLAASAGALVYVATGHLLPTAQAERRRASTLALFPLTLVATALLLAGESTQVG